MDNEHILALEDIAVIISLADSVLSVLIGIEAGELLLALVIAEHKVDLRINALHRIRDLVGIKPEGRKGIFPVPLLS